MANMKNRVQLIGHLGNDPEVVKFDSGKVKVSFRLATSENYKNGAGEWVNEVQWHTIVGWEGMAKKVERLQLTKGAEIALQGKIVHRTYDDPQGNKKYFTEINMDAFDLIKKAKEVEEQQA